MPDTAPMNSKTVSAAHCQDGMAALFCAGNRGDRSAYARFLHEVVSVMRGIIAAHGGNIPDAVQEEILQETLLAIHHKRHTWCERAPIKPWLCAVACYSMTESFRLRDRHVSLGPEDFAELQLSPDDHAAVVAAFGSMARVGAVQWIADSIAALRAGLRRRTGPAIASRTEQSGRSRQPRR